MVDTLENKKQQARKMLDAEVAKYSKDGATLPQAITLACKKFGFNPYNIIRKYYPEIKEDDLDKYKDVKTEEGSFVTIKSDNSNKQYEVININNKDAIILRDIDDNTEITASEDEITPVITENKMDKLNEAQYSVSINGLETTDAAALSQMLSSAAQAEQAGGVATDPMAVTPEPMDTATGLPMDMGAEVPAPALDTPVDSTLPDESLPTEMPEMNDEPSFEDTDIEGDGETVEDDIEFDEELPAEDELDIPAEDAEPEMPEEPAVDSELEGGASIDDEMEDMMDMGMYEGFDYDALIKEALEAAGVQLDEAEKIIPAEDEVAEDDGSWDGSQTDYAEEITESAETEDKEEDEDEDEDKEEITESDDSFDDEIAETLRIAGVELNEAEATAPTPVDEKTLYANKEAEKNEDLAPEYHEVDTTPFSKDSSEGFKMTMESAVKTDKVKKICETAKSMYAKKEVNEWMALDRRYMTKLIKEGIGYERANKLLMAAKKGK